MLQCFPSPSFLSVDDFRRRRDWIVEESLNKSPQGAVPARRCVLSRSLLVSWRLEYGSCFLHFSASTGFVPLSTSPPPAAYLAMDSPPLPEDDKTIEIGLPNSRRLTMPPSMVPTILARLLPVLDA